MVKCNSELCADVRIFRARHISLFHWEAEIYGVTCSKQVTYKTIYSAKRSAQNWCRRVGVECHVFVDEEDICNAVQKCLKK